MRHATKPVATRSIEIDAGLFDEAAGLSVDVARVVETAVRDEISAEKARRWREENADAIAASYDELGRNGLWSDGHRLL